jgi:protein O-mannosyl-transferase
VLGADFVAWDDNRNFLGNPDYRGLGLEQLRWMWTTTLMGHYVPLTWMTLGLDYTLWGMNPAGYHAVNLLFHALNAVLVFIVARRVFWLAVPESSGLIDAAAAVTALAFALHPLRTESVAWITERRDVLSTAFYLVSLLAYVKATTGTFARRWYYVSLMAFVCALLSKASAVTLPAVLLLLDVYPLRRMQTWSQRIRASWELAPFFALSAVAGMVSLFVLHPPPQLPIGQKIAASSYSFAFYLWKTLVPASLSPLYPLPKRVELLNPATLLALFVCVAYGMVAWRAWANRRGVSAVMIAFAVMILPFLGAVQNGPQIAADRYTYHAATSLSLLAGAFYLRWHQKGWRVAIGVILGWWAVLTWRQTEVWKDSDHLWSRVVSVDSTSSVGLFGLGDVRIAQGRTAEAAILYARAVAADPDYAEGHNNLGILLFGMGDVAGALREYQRAVALQPKLAEARVNLGVALARTGNDSAAIVQFEAALAMKPDLVDAEVNWGNVLVRQGRFRLAIPHYERALAIAPRNAGAHLNLGVALARAGEFSAAASHFSEALAIDPSLAEARTYLDEVRKRAKTRPPR